MSIQKIAIALLGATIVGTILIVTSCSDDPCSCPNDENSGLFLLFAQYRANESGSIGGATDVSLYFFDEKVPAIDSVLIESALASNCENSSPCFYSTHQGLLDSVNACVYFRTESICLSSVVPDSFSILTPWSGVLTAETEQKLDWSGARNAEYYTMRILTYTGFDEDFRIELDTLLVLSDTTFTIPAEWIKTDYGISFQLSANWGSSYTYGQVANYSSDSYSGFIGGSFTYSPYVAVIGR